MKFTPEEIRKFKNGKKLPCLTTYDYPMTRLLDEIGIPFLLVGDSLGMVVLGYPDTTHVTLGEMEHHLRAASRAKPKALLAADLPYQTYETPKDAVAHAKKLIAAGAEAVKAEGGEEILSQVKAIVDAGIPFCGHLGMLPQSVVKEGGYKIKGKTDHEREKLLKDAEALVEAGAFAIVLELVRPEVAAEITGRIPVPTIGIGSGPDCDGQILVTTDLIGTFPWFVPRFVKPKLNMAEQIKGAVKEWWKEIEGQTKTVAHASP